MHNNIQKKAEQHVSKLFEENNKPHLLFHNLGHTKSVVEKVKEMAGHYKLSETELLIVTLAAWFHDTGYLFAEPEQHEEKSVELMKTFVASDGGLNHIQDDIAGCIMATRMPRHPEGLLQEILCDADTFNLGTKDFEEASKQVYKEMDYQRKGDLSKVGFLKETLNLLEEHEFFTRYCKDQLNDKKMQNIKKLKRKIDKFEEKPGPEITEKEGTTKGMQTMLRLTSSNHIQLSEIADHKANILISVNSIIISIILSVLVRRLQTDPYLSIPTLIFLAVSVTTIVIAILATRPIITQGTFKEEDILNKKTNLLFFGNFHKVSQENYEKAMRAMMKDSDYLYSSIVQDIYHLGTVLGRKYKLIRLAYNVFMIGIIITVIAFALAAAFFSGDSTAAEAVKTGGSPF